MMRRKITILGVILIPACWYSALFLHESGHALVALMTGAERVRIVLPLLGFSHTAREPDAHVVLTTAAGIVFGALTPLLVWCGARLIGTAASRVLQLWAGFALILNGAYAAADAMLLGGDGGQLVRHGVPVVLLMACGVSMSAVGLWMWHRVDRSTPVGTSDVLTAGTLLLVGILSFLFW